MITRSRIKRVDLHKAKIQRLLVYLGLPHRQVYRDKSKGKWGGSFWVRFDGELHYILSDAHKSYLKLIKESHPDTHPSRLRYDPADLNIAWMRVKKLFTQKGIRL